MDDTRQSQPEAVQELGAREQAVRELAEQRRGERGALLPILHDVLDRLDYVAEEDIPVIADVLNLSR
ncbi:MAG: NADH-quinone oxidoreductase subunit E, partial [Actinomycetia bacterium]|nr:NADH-quinone oxidoreductase subunit E [Actinomycetes bacterium]